MEPISAFPHGQTTISVVAMEHCGDPMLSRNQCDHNQGKSVGAAQKAGIGFTDQWNSETNLYVGFERAPA